MISSTNLRTGARENSCYLFKRNLRPENDMVIPDFSIQEHVKVKCTLVQALRLCTGRMAHRESRGIALPFHDHGTRRGVRGSASRPGRSLPPGETRYPLCRRLGGPQGRFGQVRKISPPPGFGPSSQQPVAIPTTLPCPYQRTSNRTTI